MPRAPAALSTASPARDIVHEERVTGQHGPGLGAAATIDERESRVLGRCPGVWTRPHEQRAQLQLPASRTPRGILGAGVPVDVDRGACGGGEAAVTRDVIAWLCVSRMCSMRTSCSGRREVLVDLEAGVDNRRDARVVVADEVRSAARSSCVT